MRNNKKLNRKKRNNKKLRRQKRIITVFTITYLMLAGVLVCLAFVILDHANSNGLFGSGDESSVASVSDTYEDGDDSDSSEEDAVESTPTPTPTPEPLPEVTTLSSDLINSVYGYMERAADGAVVLDKSSTEIMYPASMTKVMTLLVAIENLTDLDEELQITTEILATLLEQHSSLAGFAEGEWVSVRDLLYGVFLRSGGEACLALANRIAGSEEAFAELMNQKAEELGLTGTHFTNSTGLHDDDHYSTCSDIAKLFKAALENELFYEIATTQTYTCEPNEYHADGLEMESTTFQLLGNLTESSTLPNGAVVMGGKTGTTNEAGYCLVSFAEHDGLEYIMVTGLAQFNNEGRVYSIEDAVAAYSSL